LSYSQDKTFETQFIKITLIRRRLQVISSLQIIIKLNTLILLFHLKCSVKLLYTPFCYVYSDRRQAGKTIENKRGWWKTDVGYTHTHTHTQTHTAHTHTHTDTHSTHTTHTLTQTHTAHTHTAHTHTHKHTKTHTHTQIYIYICVCVCVCVCIQLCGNDITRI